MFVRGCTLSHRSGEQIPGIPIEIKVNCSEEVLEQWPPTFLVPGNGFMEETFSTDLGGAMITFKLTSC